MNTPDYLNKALKEAKVAAIEKMKKEDPETGEILSSVNTLCSTLKSSGCNRKDVGLAMFITGMTEIFESDFKNFEIAAIRMHNYINIGENSAKMFANLVGIKEILDKINSEDSEGDIDIDKELDAWLKKQNF